MSYGTKYQESTKWDLWKTVSKKFEGCLRQVLLGSYWVHCKYDVLLGSLQV